MKRRRQGPRLAALLATSLIAAALTLESPSTRPGTAYAATDSAAVIDSLEAHIDTLDAALEELVLVVDEQALEIDLERIRADSCCLTVPEDPSWKLPGNWLTYSIAAVIGALAGILAVK
jgi:hypothetical protein